MSTNGLDAYLESEVLQADACKLVRMLYQRALESLGKARGHLAQAEIEARSREITRVSEILNELALAVDHDGGEVSRNLVEVYDYIQTLLHEANFKQIDPPLAEAQKLLRTLSEGWESCSSETAGLPFTPAPPLPEVPSEHVPVDCTG